MNKKVWAKGRNKQFFVCVDEETRELAKELALKEKLTMKSFISMAIIHWKLKNQKNG